MNRRESPNCLDATGDQLITHRLRMRCRNGNNAHENLVGTAKAFQLLHRQNGFAVFCAVSRGICIKCRKDIQTVIIIPA